MLDIGEFCSYASTNFLEIIYPEWRQNLLPVPKATFSSFKSTIKPIGVVILPLIFPHTKGSLRLNVKFVFLADGICDYLILGNDTFCMYGIAIFQSKDRHFTIGGDWKRKFQIHNKHTEIIAPISNTPDPEDLQSFDEKYMF